MNVTTVHTSKHQFGNVGATGCTHCFKCGAVKDKSGMITPGPKLSPSQKKMGFAEADCAE